MVRRCVALVVLALAAVACSPDEPEFFAAPQGTGATGRPQTTPPTTVEGQTASTSPAANRVPTLAGAPPPSANGNLGSGCTPVAGGDQPIDDGLWAAFVQQRQPEVVIDLICLTSALQRINNSPTLRQNPLAPVLDVFDAGGGTVDAATWLAAPPDDTLYWVAVNAGQVTSIEAIPA